MENDTICAVATPVGTGGVAIIRVSGAHALDISSKVFKKLNIDKAPRHAIFGKIEFNEIVDDAIAIYFPAPNSFTGEDVVELQIHGGYYLSNAVVEALISAGARMATPGEFSKRAVLNGKMDMSEAEGIIDIINADSAASLRAGSALLGGAMREYIDNLQAQLTDCMVDINVALDYPEYDIDFITLPQVRERVTSALSELDRVLTTAATGTKIKQGVSVVLAGKPNVGKSSILNALVGYDRAIVTDIAGTTRDTIESSYEFNGVRFNVVDTAGLRSTDDIVERVGIERAENEIERADIVLFITDTPTTPEKINNPNIIRVLNKIDKLSAHDLKSATVFSANAQDASNLTKTPSAVDNTTTDTNSLQKSHISSAENDKTGSTPQVCDYDIFTSAKTGENIEKLKQLIFDCTINNSVMSQSLILTNARHIEVLRRAKQKLNEVLSSDTAELECLSILIMDAWNTLGEITGTTANEEIINAIFSKFCLGK